MRLSRMDLFPVLTIVAGGLVGGLVSFSFLGSGFEDVSAPESVVAPSAALQTVRIEVPPVPLEVPSRRYQLVRLQEAAKGFVVRSDQIAIAPAAQAVIYRNGETGRVYAVRFTNEEQAAFERIEVFERRVGYVRERIAELPGDRDISN